MTHATTAIPAALLTTFRDTPVGIERHGDEVVVFDRSGTEVHRFPATKTVLTRNDDFVFLNAVRGKTLRIALEHEDAIAALLPEADRVTAPSMTASSSSPGASSTGPSSA